MSKAKQATGFPCNEAQASLRAAAGSAILKPRAVRKRAKAMAKRGDIIGAARTLRTGLNISLSGALKIVHLWLSEWGRLRSPNTAVSQCAESADSRKPSQS